MKKLVLLAIIGWMSVAAAFGQAVVGDIGYKFKGVKPDGTMVSITYHENSGMMGLTVKIPSNYDKELRVGADFGANLAWGNFMLSPYCEVSYSNYSSQADVAAKSSCFGTGLGVQGLVKIVGPFGVFLRYQYTIFPLTPQPFNHGESSLMGGLTLIWLL